MPHVSRRSRQDSIFETGSSVDIDTLRTKGIIPKHVDTIKILGEGELTKKLTIKAHRASATAKSKVEAAGGTIEILAA
jgi:large subunit ribosomal protein L15